MSFGPAPWQQTNWDGRAAANFICGGAGAGLIVCTTLSSVSGVALTGLLLAGVALVALGLVCVWLEIGRPLRALHVFFNPRRSWMTREALTATLLLPVGIVAAVAVPGCAWAASALALAVVYFQARMLQTAKGIPAWRDPWVVPLIVTTGLVEGAGLFFLTAPLHEIDGQPLLALFAALVIVRMLLWRVYRRRLIGAGALRANGALDSAGWMLQLVGTLAPVALIAAILAGVVSATQIPIFAAIAGFAATVAGITMKYAIVTRAGFNQGFALAHLPVRGMRP
jgi:phenylacetyl-CoA:acceptor oxidoreductase subunit 2